MSNIEIKKKLMTLLVSQFIENNLISTTDSQYKIFKKQIIDKNSDLDDIKGGITKTYLKPYNVLVSSLFKEIGSSQYIPYHLMLKWGSVYHRHKKFIIEGIDIIGDQYQNQNK